MSPNVENSNRYLGALVDLKQKLPLANRAIGHGRVLDQLERGNPQGWLELENARTARFAPAEARLDPQMIERYIEEGLSRLEPTTPAGTQRFHIAGSAPVLQPAASFNVRDILTHFGNVRPDHSPPGRKAIYLNPDGLLPPPNTGMRFSAAFVGDSNYRSIVPTTDQTRGFARLVFYVRWQDHFPEVSTLLRDVDVSYRLPPKFVPELVQSGAREEARKAGIVIDLISDPTWR